MKNWMTSLAGVIGGALVAVLGVIQNGGLEPKDLVTAAAIGAIGVLAKDLNVTGGSVKQ